MSQLHVNKIIHGFRLKRSFEIPEFRLLAAELFHERTNAKYWHLRRDDPNKTFGVQFRTTPQNDSGISHILEHTVLCGSQKFPVRDPFFKMLRRSQASFMNAMTANDWTLYPFSTMNETDYQNLCAVYSDAVFRPVLSELDFMQEGWRLEPQISSDSSSALQIKGVVYNEMKGVFSSSLNRFYQTVHNKLLPKSYPYVSGGHPDSIPKLTWEALRHFHQQCYHPSNACFYSYGDVNLEWCLEFLDKNYLQHYEAREPLPEVILEPAWDAPRMVELSCQPDPMAPDPTRQSVVSLSYRLDDCRNIYTNFVLGIVSKLLLHGDNAPFYRSLIESGFALDWVDEILGMDSATRTTTFHVGVQGVEVKRLPEFTEIVENTLSEVIRTGFPKDHIESVLHQYELSIRHESARFGLSLILGMSNAVNHEAEISEFLRVQDMCVKFREDLERRPFMLQDTMQTYLLDNKHSLLATMTPDDSWQAEQTKQEDEMQRKIVSSISTDEKERWIAKSQELLEKQHLEEDISCLPCLQLVDIPMECRPEPFTMTQVNGCSLQLNEAPTNGIVYFHALADVRALPSNLLPYVPLFCTLFPQLGADGLSYSEMDTQIELNCGGLNVSTHVAPIISDTQSKAAWFGVHLHGHCLAGKAPEFFELWSKLLRAPDWSDRQRLITLLLMSASSEWSANAITQSAHHFAMSRAAANLDTRYRLSELWSGLEQGALIKELASAVNDAHAVDDLVDRMIAIWQFVADSTRLKFSLHGESEALPTSIKALEQMLSSMPATSSETVDSANVPSLGKLDSNTYFVMPYSVHYAAQALPAPCYESPEYPAFCVLTQLLAWKFLHREIREKGGAYGGRALTKSGSVLFFSYRDPNAQRTLDAFRKSLDWACSTNFSVQDINEAKLSVFQELDAPVSAGNRGLTYFLRSIDDNLRQLQRSRLFAVDTPSVQAAAAWLRDRVELSGRAILGPDESPDWDTSKLSSSEQCWRRVVVTPE